MILPSQSKISSQPLIYKKLCLRNESYLSKPTGFQKSIGCAAYTMMQHYLWLVVFGWMLVEGVQMYLNIVQVFDAHVSKYMLKYNVAAWGMYCEISYQT